MKPGDEFTEAWVKRGEELLRIPPEQLTIDQTEELEVLQARAKSLQQPPEAEVAAAYLKAQQQRDCEEFEAAVRKAVDAAWEVIEPAIEAALVAAVRGALKR